MDDSPQWHPSTIVMFRSAAATYNYLIHFDDGWRSLVGLPDESVHLLSESVQRCTCERCTLHQGRAEAGISGREVAFRTPSAPSEDGELLRTGRAHI